MAHAKRNPAIVPNHSPVATRDAGIPVIVASSDAKELEGLCDTVIVMSRGHVVDVLRGDELTEDEEQKAKKATGSALLAVGLAFFLAELGDKARLPHHHGLVEGRPGLQPLDDQHHASPR